ncbi:MAG TPA: 6-phospho-beta-glucosidase [Ilumatobacteraceae bacterium]|nr:6-phospho-beta-glucosidase [Ilumatobacteraceae bacterium]
MKITVIGGGSTYTPELVEGLLSRREMLDLHEIHLVDTNPDRLRVLGPLAQRMAEANGGGVSVAWGADRAEGIAGAGFVVSQIRVGGMAARERDEQLGREFGLIGQETVGVGGFANALRTIPVALDIAADVARHAPDATLLNFTNPAGLVTEAICRYGDVPAIGLCNVPWTVKAQVARALGVEATQVDFDYVGLNHLSWFRGVTVDGVDRTREVLDGLQQRLQRQRAEEPNWTPDAIDVLDAIPNYYLLYYYETAAWVRYQAAHPTRASAVMAIEDALLTQYTDPALAHKPPELSERGGAYYSEAAAALMADLVSGAGTTHVVNTPNRGAIPGLPDDVVVEVSAHVGDGDVTPLPVGPLRPDVDALIRTMKDFELLTVEAAVHGDEEAALRALVTNPIGPPMSQAPAVWKRLQEVNAGWLGRLG